MWKRILIAAPIAAGLMIGLQASPQPATAGILDTHLTVEPNYDGMALLTTDSLAYQDSLPDYDFQLTEMSTGRAIPLGYGYADGEPYGEFESDYQVTTAEPLVVGTVYQAYFHMQTVRFWHCSIYDEDGCSYLHAESVTQRWRFIYTGTKIDATPYTPRTKLELGKKMKAGAHGWKITVQLTGDGTPLPEAQVTGEYRLGSHGAWRVDDRWRTDQKGRLKLRFYGEEKPTYYRFRYDASSSMKPSKSRPFSITRRR